MSAGVVRSVMASTASSNASCDTSSFAPSRIRVIAFRMRTSRSSASSSRAAGIEMSVRDRSAASMSCPNAASASSAASAPPDICLGS